MRRAKQRSKSRGRSMASSKDRQHRQAATMLSKGNVGSAGKAQMIKLVKSECVVCVGTLSLFTLPRLAGGNDEADALRAAQSNIY